MDIAVRCRTLWDTLHWTARESERSPFTAWLLARKATCRQGNKPACWSTTYLEVNVLKVLWIKFGSCGRRRWGVAFSSFFDRGMPFCLGVKSLSSMNLVTHTARANCDKTEYRQPETAGKAHILCRVFAFNSILLGATCVPRLHAAHLEKFMAN